MSGIRRLGAAGRRLSAAVWAFEAAREQLADAFAEAAAHSPAAAELVGDLGGQAAHADGLAAAIRDQQRATLRAAALWRQFEEGETRGAAACETTDALMRRASGDVRQARRFADASLVAARVALDDFDRIAELGRALAVDPG